MEKIRVFLDTSVIISYFQNVRDVVELFSERVREKVQFIVNPIVYQEIILAMRHIENIDLEKLDNFVELVSIERTKIGAYLEKMREFRNLMVHTNDILILQTAILEGDYLLTLDNQLLEIEKIDSLKIMSPRQFLNSLEGRQ